MVTLLPQMMRNSICRALSSPRKCVKFLTALLRGTYYLVLYRCKSRRIKIAFPFYAHGPVTIKGPGSVIIGKGCRVMLNVFHGLTIVTRSADAKVFIGENSLLGGLTVRCSAEIEMGARTMTASSLVDDSLYLTVAGGEGNRSARGAKKISIGNNVWINSYSVILGGSTIGDDSIISSGTCCHDIEIAEYRVVFGNPAATVLPIEKVLALTEHR